MKAWAKWLVLVVVVVIAAVAGFVWYSIDSNNKEEEARRAEAAAVAAAAAKAALPRQLDDTAKSQILQRIPLTRKISIKAVPYDPEVANFANAIAKFLTDSGYTVDGPVFSESPTDKGTAKGLQINTFDTAPSEPVVITVGTK